MADEEIITSTQVDYYARARHVFPNFFFYALMGGFSFGYNIGMIGGISSMPSFLKEFFPQAYKNLMSDTDSFDCKLATNVILNFCRSSMYLAAFASSSIVAVFPLSVYPQVLVITLFIMLGTMSTMIYLKFGMIITSRIMIGLGYGIFLQLVPAHISEMAPSRYRRQVILWFHLATTTGILTANTICFVLKITKFNDMWFLGVLSLGLLLLFVTLTPHAVLEGDMDSEAQAVLSEVQTPPSSIIFKRKYLPPLVMVICIPIFQQVTGIYIFMIYAPILLNAIGLSEDKSLLCSSIMCGVNWVVTVVSFASIDKFARRSLFIQGGFLMLISQIIITSIIRVQENMGELSKWSAIWLVVAMCTYVIGCAWSWGPLGWLVPSEILPTEIRSVGQTISVSMNMLSMFFVTQFFLTGLCEIRFRMHLVISSLVLAMTFFIYMFLPETNGVTIENMSEIWKRHPYWKKYVEEEN